MHAVMVKGCGECPFSVAGAMTCQHPRAARELVVARGAPMPAECPLRRWSVLVQAVEAPVTEAAERACCDLHSAMEEG